MSAWCPVCVQPFHQALHAPQAICCSSPCFRALLLQPDAQRSLMMRVAVALRMLDAGQPGVGDLLRDGLRRCRPDAAVLMLDRRFQRGQGLERYECSDCGKPILEDLRCTPGCAGEAGLPPRQVTRAEAERSGPWCNARQIGPCVMGLATQRCTYCARPMDPTDQQR